MSNSLYDISVGSYLQVLSGMTAVLDKGATFASENSLNVDDFISLNLRDDMLPFLFQVNCVRVHSIEALAALRSGEFSGPKKTEQRDYRGLQEMLVSTTNELKAMSAEEVNSAQGKTVIFKFGENEIPFTATNFILSFSLPNLYFHATTVYDILRMQGVPLAKLDFMGEMRIGA